jgi:hypothetical protein
MQAGAGKDRGEAAGSKVSIRQIGRLDQGQEPGRTGSDQIDRRSEPGNILMGVRPPLNPDRAEKHEERFEKQIARIYVLWLIGILVGAIHLRPDMIQIGGIRYIIDNPEVLQGVIFVACILYYVGLVANGVAAQITYTPLSVGLKRRMLYSATLGYRRTLLGHPYPLIKQIKITARVLLLFAILFMLIYYFLPLAHILFFQQVVVLKGVDAIFQTHSVENDKVILWSIPAIVGAGLALSAWTLLISKWISKRKGSTLDKIVTSNWVSWLSFSLLDYLLRHQESFFETALRIGQIQIAILAICIAVFFLLEGIPVGVRAWFNLRIWWIRRKLDRLRTNSPPDQT